MDVVDPDPTPKLSTSDKKRKPLETSTHQIGSPASHTRSKSSSNKSHNGSTAQNLNPKQKVQKTKERKGDKNKMENTPSESKEAKSPQKPNVKEEIPSKKDNQVSSDGIAEPSKDSSKEHSKNDSEEHSKENASTSTPGSNSEEDTKSDSSLERRAKKDFIRKVPVRPKFFNSRGMTNNPSRSPVSKFKLSQQEELARFKKAARAGKWRSIHSGHFDWFMFPIEDGSQNRYNVWEDDCLELKSDPEWLSGYLEGIELASMAWGWDIKNARPCDPMAKGMGWTNWDVRLAKMIRSLWIFGQKQYMESLQSFAQLIAPRGGLSYGYISLDEVFFMELD